MIAIGESGGLACVERFSKLCQPLFGRLEFGLICWRYGLLDDPGCYRDSVRVNGTDNFPEERLEIVVNFVLQSRKLWEAKVRGVA